MPAPERIVAAVTELQPESRAVIELSARRGMDENEIAVLLRMEASEVYRRRGAAIDELARALGLSGAQEAQSLRDQLDRLRPEEWEREVAGSRQRPESPPTKTPTGARSSRPALAAGLVVLAAVVAAVLINPWGDDGEAGKDAATPQPTPRPETGPGEAAPEMPATEERTRGPKVTFQRLRGTNGRGTAQLTRQGDKARVRLRVTSLLRPVGGGYAVWLFNSADDAKLLASTRATTLDASLRLPPDYERFRYVEVSREPTDDPSHSGLTLLRAPVDRLAPRRGSAR